MKPQDITRDDRPCPHCDGANTGYSSAGKYEFYTTRMRHADGSVTLYACCADNRKTCPNFRGVQILRAAGKSAR
jgi:hypothetical protein